MPEDIQLKSKLIKIIFQNKDNHFVIGVFQGEEIDFVGKGNLMDPQVGKAYDLEGKFENNSKYGDQFVFRKVVETMPEEKEEIEKLLASGIIKGVGEKTAQLLVGKFHENTLEIIEKDYIKLQTIPGIGKKKAVEIHIQYMEHIEFARVSIELQKMNIEARYIFKIYDIYGKDSAEEIKNNPFALVDEEVGVDFNKADEIAEFIGYDKQSSNRIEAAIMYALKKEVQKGHTFIYKEPLIESLRDWIEVQGEEVEKAIKNLAIIGKIKIDMLEGLCLVYPWRNYVAEQKICKKLVAIMEEEEEFLFFDIDGEIKAIENIEGIYLSPEQREGVKTALEQNLTIITGGPGTGKTTIINTILKLLEKAGQKVALAAPTGRAAKRMTESSGRAAFTIHRLLEYQHSEGSSQMVFGRDEENPLDYEVVIVDEASMIDIMLMEGLVKALKKNTRLIMVGDTDQLPPVGAGTILQDILESDCFYQVRLKEIFRQARESQIIISAHSINKGEMITANKKDGDFFFIEEDAKALETVVSLAEERFQTYLENCKGAQDIQVLCPMKKGKLGTQNLNKILQETWNPKDEAKEEFLFRDKIFRKGDKVIQMKNNYDIEYKIFRETDFLMPKNDGKETGTGIYNGDIGYITSVDEDCKSLVVIFDNEKYVDYEGELLEQLELAYALTVHKSQGSEFRAVIMPILGIPKILATRNLLYTGITRGKELVALVGDKYLLSQMIKNKIDKERNSALDIRIRKAVIENK